jgi:hypothetical protein
MSTHKITQMIFSENCELGRLCELVDLDFNLTKRQTLQPFPPGSVPTATNIDLTARSTKVGTRDSDDQDNEKIVTPPQPFTSPGREPLVAQYMSRQHSAEFQPSATIDDKPAGFELVEIEVQDECHNGSLWQVFGGRLRNFGLSGGGHPKKVIIKVSIPFLGASRGCLFEPEEGDKLDEAILHEHYIYTEQLKDLQGRQIPRYYGLYHVDIESGGATIRMYVMILEALDRHRMHPDDELWELEEEEK